MVDLDHTFFQCDYLTICAKNNTCKKVAIKNEGRMERSVRIFKESNPEWFFKTIKTTKERNKKMGRYIRPSDLHFITQCN